MSEKYKVMIPSEVKSIEQFVKDRVSYWHDTVKPDCIFLTETSAVPAGYLFKEAWKTAYPGEKPPVFYRVDPVALGLRTNADDFEKDPQHAAKLKKFFGDRIKDKDSRVVVFDEASFKGDSPEIVRNKIQKYVDIPESNIFVDRGWNYEINENGERIPSKNDWNPMGNAIGMKTYRRVGITNKKMSMGDYSSHDEIELRARIGKSKEGARLLRGANSNYDAYFSKGSEKPYSDVEVSERDFKEKNHIWQRYVDEGAKVIPNDKIIDGNSVSINTLDYIHDLKLAGRQVGEEMRREREKKKGLEHRLSLLALGSFALSLVFSASKITGLAIQQTDYYSVVNIFPILFFVVGLIGTYLILKKH